MSNSVECPGKGPSVPEPRRVELNNGKRERVLIGRDGDKDSA